MWDKTGDPPTFSPGDVVELTDLTAQEMVGIGKARYYRATETATAGPLETADVPRAPSRKAAK